MHLVIVAGGLGSRLAPLTNNIPKFLVNIGKNTGYVEQICYWENQYSPQSITVIVHSAYKALIEAYHKLYFPKQELIVKTVDVANGSAHAILSTCEHLNGGKVMFSWCDVLPNESIPFDSLFFYDTDQTIVFTNYDGACRYKLEDGKVALDPTNRGGIFGLYYVGSFHTDIDFKDGQDFVEVIDQYGKLEEYEIDKIIDFGDMPKLQRVRDSADEAREFNSVKMVGDFVLKQATNKQGEGIIKREIAWYESLGELTQGHERPSVPRAWIATDKSGFFMERVPGVPIWKAWSKLSDTERKLVLSQVLEQGQKLHDLKTFKPGLATIETDVRTEAGTKLVDRYNEIKDVIAAFGPVHTVNGHELLSKDPIDVINRVSDMLVHSYTDSTEYGFVHGDLQMSNSMVDLNTMKVHIIDPRGYFGKTVGFGLRDYDLGKLLYALSGYDLFNYSKDFGIKSLDNGDLKFCIPKPLVSGLETMIRDTFKPVHYLWLAVCWIGLAQYIKNDPVKSVCAHYHGLMLAEQTLRTID